MSTLDNLFMQIFDRRNWIVDQLKSQTDSYDQSLASYLLIHGIRPPTWLWNPNVSEPSDANAKELKKEELISGILFPPPRPPIPSSTTQFKCYSKQVYKEDSGHLSQSLAETCASNKWFIAGDGSATIPEDSINDNELVQTCYRNGVPELICKQPSKADDGQLSESLVLETSLNKCLDGSTAVCKDSVNQNVLGQTCCTTEVPELIPTPASGHNQVDAKSPEMHADPDLSLLRIQRSRSRQKALELRNSAKAENKRHSVRENIAKDYSGRVTRSRTTNEKPACFTGSLELKNSLDMEKKSGIEVTQSTSACCEEPIRVDKSSSLEKSLNCIGDVGLKRPAGPDVTILSELAMDNGIFSPNEANDTASKQIYATEVVETNLVSNIVDVCHSKCAGSKMVTANRGLNLSVSRLPSDPNMFLEPKQLTFGDMEECNLDQEKFSVLEDKKKGSFLEKGALSKSPTVQSAKEKKAEDFQLTDDFMTRSSLPAKSSKLETVFKDTEETHDFAEELVLEETSPAAEVSNGEMKALKISTAGEVEKIFDFAEVEKTEDVSSVTFTCKPSNLSAPSLNNGASFSGKKICEDAPFPLSNVIANQTEVAADLLSNSQEIGGQSSLGGQLLAVDLNFQKVLLSPQIASSTDLKCIEELDVGYSKMLSQAHAAGYNNLGKSNSIEFSDDDPNISSDACETKVYVSASDTTKGSVLNRAVTPKAAQTHNQRPRYYLRSSASHDRNLDCSKLNGSSDAMDSRKLAKTIDSTCEISWPMCKRRKTDRKSNNVFNTSPRFRRAKPHVHQIHENNMCGSLRSSKNASVVIPEFQQLPLSHAIEVEPLKVVNENSGLETYQSQKRRKTEVLESPELQPSISILKEGEYDLRDKHQHETSPVRIPCDTKLLADEYSQGCLKEVRETMTAPDCILNVKRQCTSDDGVDLLGNRPRQENLKGSAHNEGTMEEMKLHLRDKGSFSSCPGSTSYNADLDFIGADKTMPELEGFSVGMSSDMVVENGINFDDLVHLDLSSITGEQTSVLDQLYRSTSVFTPVPHSSTKYKIHLTPDVCQSLPNGLLEHMNLKKALFFNLGDHKGSQDGDPADISHYPSSVVDASLLGRSYSDCMLSSSFQFGWDVRRPPYTPPLDGKIHQKTISKSTSSSSEKQVGLNPEFTCFRIDEDTSLDEIVDPLQQGTENISIKREALVDITSEYHNSPTLVSSTGKFPDRGSIDSVNTEYNSLGTQMGMDEKFQNGYGSDRRHKIEGKENQSSSMGGNDLRKAKEFPQKRFTRSKLSEKATEKKGSETFLDKRCKQNNIVSNMSSFIPLVQQKQAAAVLTGKRDIKVKALEAAETAKRLAEKREYERKMRKEAAMVQRAKQENIRQLEQKKKEEERKKKEVEMAARKRHREEEERKEKERKRKCIEEGRKQQREHDEKLRAEKEELRRKASEEEQKRKELAEETKKQQKRDKRKEEVACKTRTEVEPSFAQASMGNAKHASSIQDDHKMSKVQDHIGKVVSDSDNLHVVNEDGIMTIEGKQELQSYDMSPYQGSDDEEDDDEEDDMVERKFIPLWARSKCLVESLLSLQHVDPIEIFPRERCSNISEVLLPLKQKPL